MSLFAAMRESWTPPAPRAWHALARAEQLAPADLDWLIWLILAGRGYGKTRIGAEWTAEQAENSRHGEQWGVIAPTWSDVQNTCLEGPSGLLAALGLTRGSKEYNASNGIIRLDNGAVIRSFSADRPDRIRGANLAGAWCDELAAWRYDAAWYEGLVPALRIGERPRVVVTTTPRPTKLVRDVMHRVDGTVHITRGSTFDNAANLSVVALEELRRRYEGTRLGRQELYGELLLDTPGALWTLALIEQHRVDRAFPRLRRVVVAVDPAMTGGEDADETGIIVAANNADGHAYVIEDRTMRADPTAWARAAIDAYREHEADCVVYEGNQGGEMVASLIHAVDPSVNCRRVTATRGKTTRAEPVSALYEQGRVHHVGSLPELEDQMCSWVQGDPKSPDRMDALVWAITDLLVDVSTIPTAAPYRSSALRGTR